MRIRIYPENPSEKALRQVAGILSAGGVIIYPTDGVYAFGCSAGSEAGVRRMCALRDRDRRSLTLVCDSISTVAGYAKVDDVAFRVLRRNTPGCFTFILPALSRMPAGVLGKRRTLGVRIPDNAVARALVEYSGSPLLSMSVRCAGDDAEYMTDAELLDEKFGKHVDAVVDGGCGALMPTTVVDMTGGGELIIRQGAAELK